MEFPKVSKMAIFGHFDPWTHFIGILYHKNVSKMVIFGHFSSFLTCLYPGGNPLPPPGPFRISAGIAQNGQKWPVLGSWRRGTIICII